jgi:hypothetical protein
LDLSPLGDEGVPVILVEGDHEEKVGELSAAVGRLLTG